MYSLPPNPGTSFFLCSFISKNTWLKILASFATYILSTFRSVVNLGSDLFLRFFRAVMSFYFVFIMK